MSNHIATQPNITPEQRAELENFLRHHLKGRDFVLLVTEYPQSTVVTNMESVREARALLNKSFNPY
jgi:hypothetical protein